MSHATPAERGLMTPANIITALILAAGGIYTVLRFTQGLGAVTNLDNNYPWGIWIGFDLMCGVALAAGGYTTTAAVYLFGYKKYHGAVRPAVLTAFLGYALVVFALHYDVGIPWRLPYPIFVSQGSTSMLFEVGLCVFLYLTTLFLEFLPAPLEALGKRRVRNILHGMTIAFTILGVVLSTLHQSSLGGLFLIAPSKLHPLWYSMYLPVFFFVSSIAAGLSMVMFESTLSHRAFHHKMDKHHLDSSEALPIGFAKGASAVLLSYFCLKVIGIGADNEWALLGTGWGAWFLVELVGFVLLPSLAYAIGARERNFKLIRFTAFWTVLGIVINRLNVSIIAFNWQLPASQKYAPALGEIIITLFVCTVGVTAFRIIVNKTPIFYEHPDYQEEH